MSTQPRARTESRPKLRGYGPTARPAAGPGLRRPCLRVVVATLALGCTTRTEDDPYANETVAACVADNRPEDGHGYESDDPACPSGPPGSPPTECPPVTPEDIAQQCEDDGIACDPDAFITRDAALCIARAEGLADGVAPWEVQMVYNSYYERPIWSISVTTVDDPADCRREGDSLVLDLETGEILDSHHWLTIC